MPLPLSIFETLFKFLTFSKVQFLHIYNGFHKAFFVLLGMVVGIRNDYGERVVGLWHSY